MSDDVILAEQCPAYDDPALLVIIQHDAPARAQSAFQCVVLRYQSWLHKFTMQLCGDTSQAEDLVQETFVKAFVHVKSFRGDASLKTWLRRIAMHTTFDLHRRRGRQPETTSAVDPDTFGEVCADRVIERDALQRALHALPYPYREILLLRYVEELSIQEISDQLELSISATKMRLLRAREQFEQSYDAKTR